MKCGQCGAEIMLGAAACGRCGWSPLGAAPVPPAQDLGGGDGPFVGGDSPAPTFAPPPPPPPGYTPPPPGQMAVQVQGAQPKAVPQGKSSGCGCLGFIILLAVAGLGVGIFAAVRDADDAFDGLGDVFDTGEEGFDGDRSAAPEVGIGAVAVEGSLGTDEVAEHPIEAGTGSVTFRAFGDGGFDPEIRIESADGDELATDDDGGDGLDSLIRIDLSDEPGAVLLVREHTGDAGDYRVILLEGDGSTLPTTGPALELDTPVSGQILAGGQIVSYPFTSLGGTITITVDGLGSFDPIVTVLAPDGVSELARNDDFSSETGRDARVDVNVADGTTVTVQVSGFGSSTGPYVVTVERAG